MNISLRQLTYFVALADERNFGRAAERVHISQPALSMQIKDLEAELKVTLVERRSRGLRLTRAGREVEIRARRILAEVNELDSAARRMGLQGRIHLGVIPTIAPYLLPRALPALRAADITRDLRIREATTETLLTALADGQLDAVVIAALPTPQTGMVAETLFRDRFLLAGRAALLAALDAGPKALLPLEIDPEQLLLLDEGHCLADQALAACAIDRRRTRVDLGAASLSTLCGLVGQGFGMTFLPEIAVAVELAAVPEICCMRFAAPEPSRDIVLLRRAGTIDDGWFGELAGHLRIAGETLLSEARGAVRVPHAAP